MNCPACGAKLTTKNYDATYEWYECPKCEEVFTYDEIVEGGHDESEQSEDTEEHGDRRSTPRKKAAGGRRAQRKNAGRKNGRVSERDAEIRRHLTRSGVEAKGKARRTAIEEDDAAIEEWEKEILKPRKTETVKQHRDEVESRMVLSALADEIQDVYHELGYELDDMNANDKALIMWREVHYTLGASARAREVPHVACKDHS